MENTANKLFDEAIGKLKEANEELCRPEEDIVSYLVCKNAQFAIENYLKGFLMQKGVDPSAYETIDDLYAHCIKINKNFEKINLSEFGCTAHKIDTSYCDEVSKVSNCYEVADNLDTFLRKENIIQ